MEQEEYTKEEIDWSYIEFVDNQDILDLIEKKPGGIIALLDEACMFPRSTYETFAEKLYQTFKDNKRFAKPKLSRSDFTICHYAGDVTYQTELFLDKNKDYVVAEHQALLSASDCSFVSGLFPPLPEESSKSSKFSSIGSQFKQQLQSLLETLSAIEPHYIRCVKPNNFLKPFIFENANVLQQLRCGGVMEAIRISCAGYPTRKTFEEFISRFKVLEPNALNGSFDEVTVCQQLLEKVDLKGYQIGKTKVFLRAGQMAELDSYRSQVLGRSACIIQKKFRSYSARKSFILLHTSAVQIQALCRAQVARHIYAHRRRTAASLTIQKNARMFLARRGYVLLSTSAILIQTGMRGMAVRNELRVRKETYAAIIIQSHCRRALAYYRYMRCKEAAITIQCASRARIACRELQKLKMAAKETGVLQEAKDRLEKEVEDLTQRLELEKRLKADIEEAKNQETAELQSALEKMQMEFEETKEQLMKEREAQTADIEEAKNQEIAKLQSDLEKMQMEFEDTKEQLMKEREAPNMADTDEAKNQEIAKLQSALEKMQMEFEETKEQLMKEREAQKMADTEEARNQETAKLQSALEQMHMELQETKEQLMKEREASKTDYIDEPKNQDAAKLQSALEKMQMELQETKEQLMKERDAPKMVDEDVSFSQEQAPKRVAEQVPFSREQASDDVAEQVSFLQEAPLIDHELVNKLKAENEKLKSLVSSLETKINETEKKYEEANKQAMEAESKIIQLKTKMQRLEEKLSDMETEDQIARRQSLRNAPSRKVSGRLVPTTQPVENGGHETLRAMASKRYGTESDNTLKSFNIERQRENIDTLLRCVTEDLGFSEGKPVAAFSIYKCLIHWRSFEVERTNVFDRLITVIGSAIEDEANTNHMAYWLSNTSILLFLLEQTLKTSASTHLPPQPTSFFGRMTQGFRSASSISHLAIGGLGGVCQVEAKYPALLFKEQLTAYVEKIYGIIRDNTKKELSTFLSLCIEAPKMSKENSLQSSGGSFNDKSSTSHWQCIVDRLHELLSTLKNNYVPHVLVQNIYGQIFSYMDVQLFNSLLLRRECCTFSNGEYVKAGLDELELWCGHAQEEYAGSSWDELIHVRQAVGFLVIHQKSRITYEDLATDLCPILSIQQLYKICTLYGDDDFNTSSVSPDVISSMKDLMPEDSNDGDSTNSFLLDNDPSIPFSVDDINNSLRESDFTGVKPATQLLENPAFEFLQG